MSKTQHTPGPWAINEEYGLIYNDLPGSAARCVCVYDGAVSNREPIWISNEEICKANARLIAASPELLEASEKLIQAMNQKQFFQEGYKNGSASISEVMAAASDEHEAYVQLFNVVKKAKGE